MHPEPTLQNVSEEEQSGGEDANEDIVSIASEEGEESLDLESRCRRPFVTKDALAELKNFFVTLVQSPSDNVNEKMAKMDSSLFLLEKNFIEEISKRNSFPTSSFLPTSLSNPFQTSVPLPLQNPTSYQFQAPLPTQQQTPLLPQQQLPQPSFAAPPPSANRWQTVPVRSNQ